MSRIVMWFSIKTANSDPDIISSILGISPDHSAKKGPERIPPRARPDTHGWSLTHEIVHGTNPVPSLSALVDRVLPIAGRLDALRLQDPTTVAEFVVCITPISWENELTLLPDLSAKLAQIGASVEFVFNPEPENDVT